MKPSAGNKPDEGDCDTMPSTLDPDEQLQLHLKNIRKSLDNGCDKTSTLDLKNFNLSELTATLFSTNSDFLDENTLEYNRAATTECILTPENKVTNSPDATLSGVEINMSDNPQDLRSQTYEVINLMDMPSDDMDMPDDIMDDLDDFLDGACASLCSTLSRMDTLPRTDVPTTLSLASSACSTLDTDTMSSPHQRIVSQPIPSVDSLSQMVFEIPNNYDNLDSDIENSEDNEDNVDNEERTEQDDPTQSIRSITYVSSFSLDTLEKEGEEEEEEVVGDLRGGYPVMDRVIRSVSADNVIRSVAPASYEDCSLKLIQSPQSRTQGNMASLSSQPILRGDSGRTLTSEVDPLISDNLDKDETIRNGCMSPKDQIKEINFSLSPREQRSRAGSVPNRCRPGSEVGDLRRSCSESGARLMAGVGLVERAHIGSPPSQLHTRSDSVPPTSKPRGGGLKRSCSSSEVKLFLQNKLEAAAGSLRRSSSGADATFLKRRNSVNNARNSEVKTRNKKPVTRKRPVSMFSDRSEVTGRDSGFSSITSSITSPRPPKPSRGIKKGNKTENGFMSSSGGTQGSGSGNSLEDVSCPSSPIMSDSSEISPPRHSTSMSSLPDLPAHNMGRSRSAASNVSDHILTTLDRPRTQSFAGTPIRQAWLQVCCYERDTQTGNFLIDKHKVQIDGKFLHPELNNDPELYRISLTGLVNEERLPKTDKMLPEIGDGVIISRDRNTGDVTLTKLCRKDVFMMNDNFLALKEDEKCKGRHEKLEQNTTYTIFNKQKFVEDVRNSAIDLTKIHTIGQVAIAFIKINGNSVKGVPCWIKVQCLEAMNLLKSLLAGSTSEEREWLRKPSMECPQSPRRSSKARLSFGKSLSKTSLKDSKSSVNSSDSGNTPIPRSKSKSQLFRNKKKSQQSNGASPEPRSNRNSGASQHLEPFSLNYSSLDATEEPPPSQALRDAELLRSRRISSPPDNLTAADVSLPLRRASPALSNT